MVQKSPGVHAVSPASAPLGSSIVAGAASVAPTETPKPGSTFPALSPASGSELEPRFTAAPDADIDKAARSAWEAFHAMLDRSPADRAALLDAAASQIAALGDALIDRACDETGLSPARIVAERERTLFTLRLFAGVVRAGDWVEATIDRGEPSRRPLPRPDVRRMLRPLGPIAVFGASNFPLAYSTAGGDTASALAAGCPVVVKGHPSHPGTGELVAWAVTKAVQQSAFHPGTFSFLHSGGMREREVGMRLIQHPCIRGAGFTGSLTGGMALADAARSRPDPIPVFAEMGSINPVFILPGSAKTHAAEAAERIAGSLANSNGQMCTCPGLIFLVRGGESETFIKALSDAVDRAPAQPMLSARTCSLFAERVAAVTSTPGVEIRAGRVPGPSAKGHPIQSAPVLLRTTFDAFRSATTLHEEVFGPAAIVVLCDGDRQVIEAAASIHGSLTGTIWADSSDSPLARAVLSVLEQRVGRVIFNGVPTGVEVCPAMVHGGPFPATNQPHTTAVGPAAIRRWARPIAYQHAPDAYLPLELRNANPLGIRRTVDGARSADPLG